MWTYIGIRKYQQSFAHPDDTRMLSGSWTKTLNVYNIHLEDDLKYYNNVFINVSMLLKKFIKLMYGTVFQSSRSNTILRFDNLSVRALGSPHYLSQTLNVYNAHLEDYLKSTTTMYSLM